MLTTKKYWMIHDGNKGHFSKVMQPTYDEACTEAQRLAQASPGQIYNVLEVVTAFCVEKPEAVEIQVISNDSNSDKAS